MAWSTGRSSPAHRRPSNTACRRSARSWFPPSRPFIRLASSLSAYARTADGLVREQGARSLRSRLESCACDRRRIAIQHRRRAEELHRLGGHGAEKCRNSDRAGISGPNDASDVRSSQCVAGKLQRCGRPLASVTVAPRVVREHICDLESGESLWFLASDTAKEATGGAFLNGPKPEAAQCPMPENHRDLPPSLRAG